MGLLDFWKKREKRSAVSGFTAEVMQMREAYISGRSGIAELTATAQSAISHWENGLALADVTGTDLLDRCTLALIGRSLAVRGESAWLITPDRLIPCSDWDLRTNYGRPTAYRLSIPEAGGGTTLTALAAEVLHVRIGADSAAPWFGTSPLRRANLTAGLLNAVEDALRETFELAPIGSQVVPMPENPDVDNTKMGQSFRGQRGRVLLRESVTVSAAGGPAPQSDWNPQSLSPDLQRTAAVETLAAAREAICFAFGVLPAMTYPRTTGPLIREGQRHLAQWWLQPIASLIAEEATEKLGSGVTIDVMSPLQAYDAGGRARALATAVQALTEAKAGGIAAGDIAAALSSSIGIDSPQQ
ncbi:phage portal protein [Bradyrhizobium elkanii]|uniref:phage portal protein n=1 Tax=Bradyrhizobium elkanii TaxID=29448 RepID=UPI0027121AEA|nr:phage portal protein [Bradyrhizobium elkanii]WLA36174.1 phage portal protein [Bradyrhizobium elkanii]